MKYDLTGSRDNPLSFEDIEESIKALGALQFIDYVHDTNLSLEQFIYKLGVLFNKYKDNEDVHKGAYRSIVDATRICKYYYPNTTFKEVAKVMCNFPEGSYDGQFCGDIKRYTFCSPLPYALSFHHRDKKTEFGYTFEEMKNF